MASKTADLIKRETLGSLGMIRLNFTATNLDNGDTITIGSATFPYVSAWFAPSTTTGVVGVAHSAGVLTVACSADNQVGDLFVLVRG